MTTRSRSVSKPETFKECLDLGYLYINERQMEIKLPNKYINICNRLRIGIYPIKQLNQSNKLTLKRSASYIPIHTNSIQEINNYLNVNNGDNSQYHNKLNNTSILSANYLKHHNHLLLNELNYNKMDTINENQQLTEREHSMHGKYILQEAFANGSYGKVCRGEMLPDHKSIAIKIILKSNLFTNTEKQSVIREQIIHKSLNHPGIIKLIDTFEDKEAYYFILERAENGSLMDYINEMRLEGKHISELIIRKIMKQLLKSVSYLHENGIVHHDIKPENILFIIKKENNIKIKLCDFGAARAFNTDAINNNENIIPFSGIFGTPGYIAPELLLGKTYYSSKIDIFSIGIIFYLLIYQYTPFYPPSNCIQDELHFPKSKYLNNKQIHKPENNQINNISKNGSNDEMLQDLIKKMLDKNPNTRISAKLALSHPWFHQNKTKK